jgi:thiol-disulfide isomerase/thioredoxin
MTGYEKYTQAVSAKGSALRKERLLAARIRPGRTIPPFHLKSLEGTTVSSDDLKGKVVVIDFWAVWCPACVAALPDIQRLAVKYKDDPQVAILSIDAWDPMPKLQKWMQENAVSVPVLFDDSYINQKAKVDTFPTTWFLDRQGLLNYAFSGNETDLVEEDSWLIEDLKSR